MKKVAFLFVLLSLIVSLDSCKKKKAFKNEDGQASEDNRNVQQQTDNAVSDGDNVVTSYPSLTGKQIAPPKNEIFAAQCGFTVDLTDSSAGSIKLNYDGVTVCSNRKRSGSIKLTIQNYSQGVRWYDTAAVLQVDYIDYKVTRASDGKSIKFNGTHYVTNVIGGNIWTLIISGNPVIRTITGSNLQVTFDDGSVSTWNINRKYTYTKTNVNGTDVYTCTGEGIGSYNGESNLENWGTTRDGDAFTSKVESPVIWNTTCGWWAPVQGKLNIKVSAKDFSLVVTMGINSSGDVVTPSANNCPWGWKVEWSYKNKTNDKKFAYW
ncbi:MAG: hypothetical protein Q8M29_04410 [Bacteroidota bacterium]|nr:hypothetical protein [Bacteroidota bacterium]